MISLSARLLAANFEIESIVTNQILKFEIKFELQFLNMTALLYHRSQIHSEYVISCHSINIKSIHGCIVK